VTEGGDSPRRRRPRYAGTHPRTFSEKYKERDPERFPELREKVLAAGKTPAGAHVPVLVAEVLEVLAPRPGAIAVDATLGWGGHAQAILPRLLPGGRLIGLDVDPVELPRTEARLRAKDFGENVFVAHRSNFAGLPKVLASEQVPAADIILADLGASSMQLDDPARGFSYKRDGPLDMRMNPARGVPAGEALQRIEENLLRKVLSEGADEPYAEGIARAIAQAARSARASHHLLSTLDLARAIESAIEGSTSHKQSKESFGVSIDSLARTFQALRIFVNEEFTALEAFLRILPSCLAPGGRVAILTFHSGEDRRVKKAFQAGEKAGVYARIAREVIRPAPEERHANPRSSAAKLRWAIRA
jgi:16S rRNA (cytosine1402-N4)-methyltransferase